MDWNGAKWLGMKALPDSMQVAPGLKNPASVGDKLKQRAVVPLFRKWFLYIKK